MSLSSRLIVQSGRQRLALIRNGIPHRRKRCNDFIFNERSWREYNLGDKTDLAVMREFAVDEVFPHDIAYAEDTQCKGSVLNVKRLS